jgi:assimilatory nitrate reductase catalytic subunit
MLHLVDIENRVSTRVCATHCPYCSLQCGMHLRAATPDTWSVEERDFPTNRGGLCQKGWTSAELLDDPDRLRTPLLRDRRDSALREASWEEALDRILAQIDRAQKQYGKDGVGVLAAAA